MVGAIDVTTDEIETPEEVASTLRKALNYVMPERLYTCTNYGMVQLARKVAQGKLRSTGNLVSLNLKMVYNIAASKVLVSHQYE